jgi:hypothetical protein
MHLEFNEIAPVRDPLIEQTAVMGFHELIATFEFDIDPT